MYYYDIYLFFSDSYFLFYNWDFNYVERFLKMKVYKVDDIKVFINNIVKINHEDDKFIITDGVNAIALEVINNLTIYISSLKISDENEICKLANNLSMTNFDIEIVDLRKKVYDLQEFILPKKILLKEIVNGESDFIKFIYYKVFNKKSSNIELMKNKLLDDIINNFNYNYLSLFNQIYK